MSPRPSKRARVASSSQSTITTKITNDDKHAHFTSWARDCGIEINAVTAASIPGRGIGLLTARKVRKGELLIFVPEKAMIAALPRYLKDSSLSAQAKLTATLIELRNEEDDKFTHCRSVWPTPQDFESSLWWFTSPTKPLDWEVDLPQALSKPRNRLQDDLVNDLRAIYGSDAGLSTTLDADDVYLWTIANTRSFSFKPNGRSEGVMVICPFLDYMNHCPSGEGCHVSQDVHGYSLTANRDYKAGEEILATYGSHPNDKLLVHYGFILPESKDDAVSLDEIILPTFNHRQRQDLESVGFLGNYSLTPSSNEICFRTQVALRSVLTTSNEWEFFMNSGDDIADDKSASVCAELRSMLESYMKTLQMRQDNISMAARNTRTASSGAIHVCSQRWSQIEVALRIWLRQTFPNTHSHGT